MNKLLLFLIFFNISLLNSSSECLTEHTADPYSGTIVSHPIKSANCSCPCNRKRYNGITCSECGHKVRGNKSTNLPIANIAVELEKLAKINSKL